jgi:pyruvate carboxylase
VDAAGVGAAEAAAAADAAVDAADAAVAQSGLALQSLTMSERSALAALTHRRRHQQKV